VGSDHQPRMRADSATRNGDALALRSPRGTRDVRPSSGFSPARPQDAVGSGFRTASKLRNHLRPDRNHRDKQRNRRQRRRFFHKHPQHRPTPYDMRTYEEHCSFFVL